MKRLAANAPYNFLNSYRNLVACCAPCNMAKRDRPAMDLLRQLYRDHRISAREFSERVHKLKLLADGKLKPLLPRRRNSP